MLNDLAMARTYDPGRGPFCATTKQGLPLSLPPVKRDPIVNRDINPRGVRHIDKTRQDYLPKEVRPRHQAWLKRQGA